LVTSSQSDLSDKYLRRLFIKFFQAVFTDRLKLRKGNALALNFAYVVTKCRKRQLFNLSPVTIRVCVKNRHFWGMQSYRHFIQTKSERVRNSVVCLAQNNLSKETSS